MVSVGGHLGGSMVVEVGCAVGTGGCDPEKHPSVVPLL